MDGNDDYCDYDNDDDMMTSMIEKVKVIIMLGLMTMVMKINDDWMLTMAMKLMAALMMVM